MSSTKPAPIKTAANGRMGVLDETTRAHLALMRHSCAHLLAAAVQDLWPTARFGVGPATDQGFYYDILFPEPISETDFPRMRASMRGKSSR